MGFKGGRYYLVIRVEALVFAWSHERQGFYNGLYDTSWATEMALRDYVKKYKTPVNGVFIRTPKGKFKKI